MSRVVLFGATGYTGRLTAARLAAAPLNSTGGVILAGRDRERLEALREDLERGRDGGPPLSTAVANVEAPETVIRLLKDSDDVLISCVGPFQRWGRPAVDAAIAAGATYLDSTGEPEFLLRLFEDESSRADSTGARLVPAFGYDYVPGSLAGALALRAAREAGTPASEIAIGYFSPGAPGISSGTAASGPGILLGRSHAFRSGRLVVEYPGQRTHEFGLGDRSRLGLSVGGTEHFDLPATSPEVETVGVFLGQVGKATREVHYGAVAAHQLLRLPFARRSLEAIAERTFVGSKGGPESLAGSSLAIAEARDARGKVVSAVTVRGPSPYDLTARLLAWGATHAELIQRTGTMGPVSAFGLADLEAGCADVGLVRAVG